MLTFLRSNHFGVPALSLLIMGVLWGLLWLCPPPPADYFDWYKMPLFESLETLVPAHHGLWMGVTVVLTILQAALLIWWNQRFDLIPRIYFMPGLIYILITGSFPPIQQFNPALLFGIALSLAIIHLMDSLRREAGSFQAMGATLLITLSGLLYLWGLVYLLTIWYILARIRSGSWRDMAGSALGIILPLFLTFSLLYLSEEQLGEFFQRIIYTQWEFRHPLPEWPVAVWVLLGYMALMFLLTFPTVASKLPIEKVISRKGFSIMVSVALISLGLFFALPSYHPELYWIMAIPLSFLYSHFLSHLRSGKLVNVVIFVWIALIIWVRVHYIIIS